MKRLLFILGILWVFGPLTVGAKEWDPRLQHSVELSFAGQPEAAEGLLETYRREFPQDPNGYLFWTLVQEWKAGLGMGDYQRVHAENRKLLQQALELAEQRQKSQPHDVDALVDLGNSYFFLARSFAEQGSGLKAGTTGKKLEKPMREALERDPSRKETFLALGAFHYFAGNTPKILAPFKALLGIHGNKQEGLKELSESLHGQHPFLWQARFALLEIYSSAEKNSDLALLQLQSFEESFPHNPVIPLKKAYIYEQKDPPEAIRIYLQLAEQCGKQYVPCPKKFLYFSYSQAGWLALQQGEPKKAMELLDQSLALDPGDYPKRTGQVKKWQKKARQELEKLEKAKEKNRT